MYMLPNDQIDFAAVRAFCLEEHEEGLDLDYKADWPKDLAPILCGMANVQGGMVLLGVATAKGSRKPAWPPPGVPGTEDQLNQRAVQIAYDGIYPPLLPQIKVCPFDTDPTRAVVVIRVDASRLMHATDQRRRIYIRVADHDRGYELADLSQLEWLWQQREASVALRQSLLTRAANHAEQIVGPARTADGGYVAPRPSKLVLYAAPMYPRDAVSKAPPDLAQAAKEVGALRSSFGYYMDSLPSSPQWRTTTGGIFVQSQSSTKDLKQYVEIGQRGHVYVEQVIHKWAEVDPDNGAQIQVTVSMPIITFCELFLTYASTLFDRLGWRGPVELGISLAHVRGVVLDHRRPGDSKTLNMLYTHCIAQDPDISLLAGEFHSSELRASSRQMLADITCNLMWSFGYPDTRSVLVDNYLPTLLPE